MRSHKRGIRAGLRPCLRLSVVRSDNPLFLTPFIVKCGGSKPGTPRCVPGGQTELRATSMAGSRETSAFNYLEELEQRAITILQWPFASPKAPASSLSQNAPHTHVPFSLSTSCAWGGGEGGALILSCMQVSLKFGYFLLLVGLMSIWLLDQPQRTSRIEKSFFPVHIRSKEGE